MKIEYDGSLGNYIDSKFKIKFTDKGTYDVSEEAGKYYSNLKISGKTPFSKKSSSFSKPIEAKKDDKKKEDKKDIK